MANSNRPGRRPPEKRRVPGSPPGASGSGRPAVNGARPAAPRARRTAVPPEAPRRLPRRLPGWLSWAVPAVILVAALAGYFAFVPMTVAGDAKLDGLVVQQPGISGLVPKPSASTDESTVGGLPALAHAGVASPLETGSWSIDWTGSGATQTSAEAYMVLDLLPSAAQARTLRSQLDNAYLGKTTYNGEKFAETATFTIPQAKAAGLASSGSAYRRLKSKTLAAAWLTTITEQVGRAVALIYVQLPTVDSSASSGLAARELALLERNEPGFTLATTHYPLAASLIWWVVALVLAASAFAGPKLVVAARRRGQARQEALERAQFRMRGQKVLRRRGGPQRNAPGRRSARR